jgi:hypothetical protein
VLKETYLHPTLFCVLTFYAFFVFHLWLALDSTQGNFTEGTIELFAEDRYDSGWCSVGAMQHNTA